MSRMSIGDFRARLAGSGDAPPLLRAYRELARRGGRPRGASTDWVLWTGHQDDAGQPRAAFAEWNPWSGRQDGAGQARAAFNEWIPWGASDPRSV